MSNVLMIQGTSSSVGKSLIVAALCRIFARRGLRVAPFKAQNMSNKAAVCADGAEIGRAQAFQAAAAGVEPAADMNPILLKPEGHARAQVIVGGRVWQTLSARSFYEHKKELWTTVTAALDRLRARYDLIIIEGAGSPVELNLREGDIVNMAVARYAQAPVLLVADIDRGGVFAQLLGTLALLPAVERALVRGLIVNKFRGDPALFCDGVRILEERGVVPVLGIVPYMGDLILPEEDAAALEDKPEIRAAFSKPENAHALDITVIRLPHIANFDDFDPLRAAAGVTVRYVDNPRSLGPTDAIVLPGSKSTMADLLWLRERGWDKLIRQKSAEGMAIAGICGGYQMLGRRILDPNQIESSATAIDGLELLPVETTFAKIKATHQVHARVLGGPAWLGDIAGRVLIGYEIHMGTTPTDSAWLEITERNGERVEVMDGAVSANGQIWGCYLHGLFHNDSLRAAWLNHLRHKTNAGCPSSASVTDSWDLPADTIEAALGYDRLCKIALTRP